MQYTRRFVFVHYDDLAGVQFKQLEKVTDKLFVFVPEGVASVPMWLVRQTQEMGRDLVWVDIGEATYDEAQLAIGFHAGQLHTQTDPGVEFVLLSGAEEAEALVDFMQASGRPAVRARRRSREEDGRPSGETADASPEAPSATKAPSAPEEEIEDLDLEVLNAAASEHGDGRRGGAASYNGNSVATPAAVPTSTVVEREARAEDIVRELIRAGQRPPSLAKLRSYLVLYGSGVGCERDAEEVIGAMVEKGEIAVSGERVVYRF